MTQREQHGSGQEGCATQAGVARTLRLGTTFTLLQQEVRR